MNLVSEKATAVSSVSAGAIHLPPVKNSSARHIFTGPNGLRAGWRLLIFVSLVVFLLGAFVLIRNGGVQGFKEAQKHAAEITVTPLLAIKSEAMAFLLLCVATLIMAKIEHRKFSEYGLPLRWTLGKDLWRGSLWGLLAISGTLLTMFLLHGFRITGLALHGNAILSSIVAWGIAFLLAGLFEEFLCRGYAQYTLASGIGFWPAAFVMSGMFAFGHSFNVNETAVGVVATGLFGLLHCLFLRRTGTLWIAVGFHLGWDWGQTFYGVPDSGMLPYHNVFSSTFSGPLWLTGGIVGPEASILCPIALLVVALIFSHFYRENRYQTIGSRVRASQDLAA
ncbi:MAG: lysostaphin resistance A-like protein [Terriglobales bacterium]